MAEAPHHPHNVARGAFAEVGGMTQPMPAPRYSGSPTAVPAPQPKPGTDTQSLLSELGYDADRIASLRASNAVAG
jgi:alpha-methylacyl-CoA racemase